LSSLRRFSPSASKLLALGLFVVAVLIAGCGGKEVNPAPATEPERDAAVIETILNAETPDGRFSDLPTSLSGEAELRTTYFSIVALSQLGGVPPEVRSRTVTWTEQFLDGAGWVRSSGSLEPVDVAILVFRLGEALGTTELQQRIDPARMAEEAERPVRPEAAAARVSRMAWALEMLGPTATRHEDLRSLLEGQISAGLASLTPRSSPGDAAGLSQFPPSVHLPADVQSEVTGTLEANLAPAYGGPWTEHLLGLWMMGSATDQSYTGAFSYWDKAGAPTYWGRIGAIEAFLLASTSARAPGSWPADWRKRLRLAVLLREARGGGFFAPVVAQATVSNTAAAVVALYYAGGTPELNERRATLATFLCAPGEDGNDPRIRAALVGHAIRILRLDCAPPEAPPGGTPLQKWLTAIANNRPSGSSSCPTDLRDGPPDRTQVLLAALAQEEGARSSFVHRCLPANDLISAGWPTSTVWDLYVLAALRILAGVGIEEREVLQVLEKFSFNGGYGEPGAGPTMGDTCQAEVLKTMVASYVLLPIVCIT